MQQLEIIDKTQAHEITMDLRTWSFWLGVYSVLTHKPTPVKVKLYGK